MRIGVVGAGNIVNMCLDALAQIDDVVCEALCVREASKTKGQQLCDQYAINKLYTDYASMLTDSQIDFIYIGIPNNMHFDYALQALNANKHVVCEKPFTTTAQELTILMDTAKQKDLFLFEAITNIHSPNVKLFKEKLPLIGDIKLVQGNYSQLSSRYAAYLQGEVHPAFDPKASGGALYDINIYNIHLACFMLGAPTSIQYTFNRGFNGIDMSGVVVMQHEKAISMCAGAKDSDSEGRFVVQGDKGYLAIQGIPNVAASFELGLKGQEVQTFNLNHADNHMVYEFQDFNQMFKENDLAQCYRYLEHSLEVMKVLQVGRDQVNAQ